MTRRPGLSLTEVLVALFIMGIGTIAILTLFPLGALNMAQALRDDRTTQAAGQADAYLRWYVNDAKTAGPPNRLTSRAETWFPALTDPGYRTVSKYLVPVNDQAVPSYAVVIDPMGQIARGGSDPPAPIRSATMWAGDNGFGNGDRANFPDTTAIPRHTLAIVNDVTKVNPPALRRPFAQRICTLLDGMGYDKASGAPDTSSGSIDRDIRYNWLWVVQKPLANQPSATVTVVVFDRRAPMFAPAGAETVHTPSAATPGQTLVSFGPGQAPPVQKGGWLMDATVVAGLYNANSNTVQYFVPSSADGPGPLPSAAAQPRAWIRNAIFYRVVGTAETAGGGLDVELEVPLRPDSIPPLPASGFAAGTLPPLPPQFRRFVYLTGAAEVFVRPLPLDLQ